MRGVGYTLDSKDMIGDAYYNAGIDLWNVTDWGHDATGDLRPHCSESGWFHSVVAG